jgi:hypothetical protein
MAIACNEINQTANYLLAQFQDCTKLKAEDMQLLVELIVAVSTCANGGPNYNTINNDLYEPITDEIVTYPVDSFHAISVVVLQGTIIYNGVTYPTGTTINIEFTTTNQQTFTFTAKTGSRVAVEYITETV